MSTSNPKIRHYKSLLEIPEKYLAEWYKEMRKDQDQGLIIDDSVGKQVFEAAYNMQLNEIQAKEHAKRHEEELRIMEQREKQQREEAKRRQEYNSAIPEYQLQMFLSGTRGRWKISQ